MTREYLDEEQLIERWHIPKRALRGLANKNLIETFRPTPRRVRFPIEAVEAYEERNTRKEKKKKLPKRKALSVKNPKKKWRIE